MLAVEVKLALLPPRQEGRRNALMMPMAKSGFGVWLVRV